MEQVAGPLAGLKVVCMAEQYPGPYATLVLADLGAEVVIVERPDGGDPARQFPAFHAALNRGKRAVALDLKQSGDQAALRMLLSEADVLFEGFRPGTMSRLGFGFDALHALNPRLVYVSISGFGQSGPYRDRPAHDLSYQAVAGLLFQQARAQSAAPLADLAIGDLSSAMFALTGCLAALHERTRTGRGRHVDVSMTDGLVSWMSVQLVPAINGRPAADLGQEPAYAIYACADQRLISVSIAHEDKFWRALCGLMDMAADADLTHPGRREQTSRLRAVLASRFAAAPRRVWAARLEEAGIPWGPVNDLQEVGEDPHFVARGLFRTLQSADGVATTYVAQPLRFDDEHPGPHRGVPALGEANQHYLDKESRWNRST